ncbi:MAG TPA: citramalate synthase [Ruminococcaceae bacterium]|nr:citramalate synthase [Oscillospiraceae bacterium]
MKKLEIFDSTLRDGAQSEGISFSVQDKINIVKALDEFGVAYIEAGNPSSNPKDIEFFKQAAQLELKNAKLCAFGSTRRKNMSVELDENVISLLGANTQVVSIFGKSWDLHVTEILNATLDENLALVFDTVSYLKSNGKEVVFDAEHFFDGYKANPEYAMKVLQSASDAGADVLCLCDTNGGTLPSEIFNITKLVCDNFAQKRIGIHCHNDIGCAVANSMIAVDAGAVQVQGTFIGFGERCGNADLSVIIPNLQLKQNYRCVESELDNLSETVIKLAEISNITVANDKPYTGRSAFAHKGGMHIDGVSKLARSFEHIDPAAVGNKRRFLMSEVSGRTTVLSKIKNIAPELTKNSPETAMIVEKLKELEHKGYQFEAADASFELFVRRLLGKFEQHFSLIMYKTTGEYPAPDGEMSSSAIINIKVDGKNETAGAIGNGPVNALDLALRRALSVFFPQLSKVHLIDYKVRVLETDSATGARVRVLIESTDGESTWTTVGASTDIIEASWIALVDSIEYKLSKGFSN